MIHLFGGTAFLLASCAMVVAQVSPDPQGLEQARILRDKGEHKAAIGILRALLRAEPDSIAVREELGYALILDRQMAAAQYQFEILKERIGDPELRGLYMAVLRRIVAERPVGVTAIFDFTPTSNINQGTDNTTLTNDVLGTGVIAPESRRQSGWKGRIGLQGYVRGNLGANEYIIFDWRAQRHFYSTLYTPETEIELGLSFSKNMSRGDIGTRIFRLEQRRDRGDYSRTGIAFFGGRELAPGRGLNGSLQFAVLDMEVGPDSIETQVDLGYALTPSPALALRFGMQGARVNARVDAQSYSSLATTAQVSKAFRNGYELSAQAVAGRRLFDSDLGFARKESFAEVSVTVFNSWFSVGGVVPKLTCTLSATASNVALFDTDTRACGVALSRKF